jgi:superfamily I DNA/RNA helicase
MEKDRAQRLQQILESDASHKLIISGPGTGKTYTFGQILERDPGNSLVITLINNLVDDMQKELGELADVRTFHSLARMIQSGGLIADGFSSDDFGRAFRLLNEEDGSLGFFIDRANYYDAVGFDDSVYRVLGLFRNRSDAVPSYHHVMVDEYQDFNDLEVGVIAELESVNRMLVVGDDDQSIYEFRQASPSHLREKASDKLYAQFLLPYSTRCTEAVIAAVDSVIKNAQKLGCLQGRLEKEFVCYLPEKQQDSESFPTIQVAVCTVQRANAPYISRYIESIISSIDEEEQGYAREGGYPLALVVGPGHYLDQIYEYLTDRFENVTYRRSTGLDISIADGFRLLRERANSNLGWRILVELLATSSLEGIVSGSADNHTPIVELLENEFIEQQLARLDAINRAIVDIDSVSAEDIADLQTALGQPIDAITQAITQQDNDDVEEPIEDGSDSIAVQPSILLTNFNGCKGLSAGYTFVTGMEQDTFPRDNRSPSDTEICQFIVTLTRTRKQCHLIHTRNFAGNWTKPSLFLDWIPDEISEVIQVNKDFF